MQNTFTCSDGHIINFDDERPRATPKQVKELKQYPELYGKFCERVNAYNRTRYKAQVADPNHKAKIQEQRKQWRKSDSGREHLADYAQRYREKYAYAKILSSVRSAIRCALFLGTNIAMAEENLGCSIDEYRCYLESKFVEGMSWANYGKGIGKWCIDHVKPIAFFDLNDPEDRKRGLRWTNTQPIWNKENLVKWHIDKAAGSESPASFQSSVPSSLLPLLPPTTPPPSP